MGVVPREQKMLKGHLQGTPGTQSHITEYVQREKCPQEHKRVPLPEGWGHTAPYEEGWRAHRARTGIERKLVPGGHPAWYTHQKAGGHPASYTPHAKGALVLFVFILTSPLPGLFLRLSRTSLGNVISTRRDLKHHDTRRARPLTGNYW